MAAGCGLRGVFVLLVLVICCVIPQSVEAKSFANLVKTVSLAGDTTNSSNPKYIYETGPACVAFTSSRRQGPYIDVGLGTTSRVRTVLIYLSHTGTDYRNIWLASRTHSFKKHKDIGKNIVAIWEGDYSTHTWLRIGSSNSSFTLCLIKVYDVTLEDYCACDDTCHRNADVICDCVYDAPHDCHKVNVALNKPAQMSSSYRKSNASYAVNGITGTTFSAPGYTSDSTQWNCIHTDPDDWSPYWQVDLGKEYTVNSVIIYRRGGGPGRARMAGVTVTVDDNLCSKISFEDARVDNISVICNTAPRGRFVNITRRGTYSIYGPSINLCEVQVWVCKPGYYGFGCTSECSEGCSGERNDCNIDNGFCTKGCDVGWYTATCSEECGGGCTGGRCNQTDGRCSPCLPSWTGDRCDECDAQHYGDDCSKACGYCRKQNRCDRRDGSCPNDNPRCQPGYTSRYCNEFCSTGRYGPDCRQSCSEGCSAACDGTTGHCGCSPGWKESNAFCKEKCDWGTYGKNCSSQCGEGCQNTNNCNRTTGHCSCRVGYNPPLCDKECEDKTYGQDCESTCGEGCKDGRCNPKSGQCDCGPGWDPEDLRCEKTCKPGFHGNCSTECGHCAMKDAVCNHVTGHCPQGTCDDGFAPPLCAVMLAQGGVDDSGSSNVGIIAGVLVSVLFVAFIVAAVLWIWKKKRRSDSTSSHKPLTARADEDEERMYANAAAGPLVLHPVVNGNGAEAYYVNRASTAKALDDLDTEDEGDLLDSSQEDSEVVGDERWAVYQSIKVALDPLQQQLLDRLADTDKIKEEFKELPAGLCKPYTVGSLEENKPKNRFKRLFPYDHTRVILTPLADDPSSDYINASYIRNLHDEQAYIATQGPLPHTVGDLWRLVWQENVTQIVMLTNVQEKEKVKCHSYWPEKGERMDHPDVIVEGADVQLRADFYVRSFLLRKDKTSRPRQVTQYHMVVWPDHGVPSALALVNLQRYISARTDPGSGPLLVHCSAGVGRTGTYIALDMLMQELKAQKQMDVLKTVTRMREDRVIMIQNVDQYVFLHEVLLEAYTSRDARVSVEDVDRVFPTPVNTKTDNSRIDREFKSLCQMKNFVSKQTYTMAQQKENQAKNRDSSVMADDAHLVYLSVHVAGRNQYINAVSVPSFRQQRGMLLTQLPLADTAVDFWRLVEGFDVATIVSLGSSDEEKKQDYCHYWPRVEKSTSKAGPYVIKMTSWEVLGETLTSYSLSIERGKKLSRNIRLFHLSDWVGETPGRTSDVLALLGALDTVQSGDTDTPIVIQCRDGARKSGLVCALSNMVSRLTYDRELDVYLTVRHVHNARPQAVTSKAQYRYCYQVALEYKKSFDIYANS